MFQNKQDKLQEMDNILTVSLVYLLGLTRVLTFKYASTYMSIGQVKADDCSKAW